MIAVSVLTTVLAVGFALDLGRRAGRHRPHLLWWTLGVIAYGTGTAAAAIVDRTGWSPAGFRIWYIAGAVFGGSLLALGTVHLLHRAETAHRLTQSVLTLGIGASIAVLMAPIQPVADATLAGASIAWVWVRAFTPFLNLFAVVYLVGGAIVSARRYARQGDGTRSRVMGNTLIALGGITPAFGGVASRLGGEDTLTVTLLVGLVLIWAGARLAARPGVQAA